MSQCLRRGNWSVQELERLRLLLPQRGVEQTAALLRRSADSVQRKALDLLRVTPRKGAWTDSDDWQLRQAWGAVEPSLLAPMLGRPINEVRARAAELRERLSSGAWTREERRLLKKLYGTRSDDDLEVSLMRSRDEIANAAIRMCLAKDKKFRASQDSVVRHRQVRQQESREGAAHIGAKSEVVQRLPMPRWTSAEVEQLSKLYPDQDNLSVARILGRSVTSVANKAFQLGIHKSAVLLASIGRANIAHRYQVDEGMHVASAAEMVRAKAGAALQLGAPVAGAPLPGAPLPSSPLAGAPPDGDAPEVRGQSAGVDEV